MHVHAWCVHGIDAWFAIALGTKRDTVAGLHEYGCSLGSTCTMSSYVRKTRQPILCAQLIAYRALSVHSRSVAPGSTSAATTHSDATVPSSCSRKTPVRNEGSPHLWN